MVVNKIGGIWESVSDCAAWRGHAQNQTDTQIQVRIGPWKVILPYGATSTRREWRISMTAWARSFSPFHSATGLGRSMEWPPAISMAMAGLTSS